MPQLAENLYSERFSSIESLEKEIVLITFTHNKGKCVALFKSMNF